MGHLRWCYPRTTAYIAVVVTVILLLQILDLLGGR